MADWDKLPALGPALKVDPLARQRIEILFDDIDDLKKDIPNRYMRCRENSSFKLKRYIQQADHLVAELDRVVAVYVLDVDTLKAIQAKKRNLQYELEMPIRIVNEREYKKYDSEIDKLINIDILP